MNGCGGFVAAAPVSNRLTCIMTMKWLILLLLLLMLKQASQCHRAHNTATHCNHYQEIINQNNLFIASVKVSEGEGCRKRLQQFSIIKLVGRSSPYCGDMWRRYCCLTSFFPIVDMYLSGKDIARQSCAMVPRWRFWRLFCILCFQRATCGRFQTCILNSH